jgi:membrane protease YdiL (CAAX protease family)
VACLFAFRIGGRPAVAMLLARAFDARRIRTAGWGVAAASLMPVVLLATDLVLRLGGLPPPIAPLPWSSTPALLLAFLVAAAGEELAWSATVLEPLQVRTGALRAALVVGLAGALWHVVPFVPVRRSASWIFGQCPFTVAFRVVLLWLYANAGRSVFATILFHASYNVAWQLFPDRGSGYDPWVAAAREDSAPAAHGCGMLAHGFAAAGRRGEGVNAPPSSPPASARASARPRSSHGVGSRS